MGWSRRCCWEPRRARTPGAASVDQITNLSVLQLGTSPGADARRCGQCAEAAEDGFEVGNLAGRGRPALPCLSREFFVEEDPVSLLWPGL
ncbi:hypothetical protein Francci3_3348 [Frankia casuarinae]|uniref:Uncharacterized protein n=1 Tax=Frankia casuarinae (strain DSM 45818 / CECT 9043 / HFP020203 / CcI3) TaxID=106370 RepID=Q2J7N7_FRACC|nr:hypothetical protein Francci3_3348 [Frankia casuarinae]